MSPASPRPRVGILGGAFDPPHRMHRALAEAALQQLQLDALRVLPTGLAWHKARALSPAPHRLAMTRLAFANCPGVTVDERELGRSGPSYTVDTLRELHAEQPHTDWFLIIGQDQAAAFTGWHEWQLILQLAIICIAERPDEIRGNPEFHWKTQAPQRVLTLQVQPNPMSATDIRHRAAHRLPLAHLVAEPVARYIETHHLYLPA